MSSTEVHWPHAPDHRLGECGTYFVTSGTYLRSHFFRGPERLKVLHASLLEIAHKHGWALEAWAVFSNHYHFVGRSPVKESDAQSLATFLSELHTRTATEVNEADQTPGRKVWHNYWETILTFEKSYYTRLNYVHQNAVKHGLVGVANLYPWCSAAWFEGNVAPGMVKTIHGFKIDQVKVYDEYTPAPEW